MDLLQQFKEYIKEHHLFLPSDVLLLAVSGGVDSVVLCHLCKQAGYHFIMAHCNFKLRGDESERDAALVQQLAHELQAPLLVKEFDTKQYAAANKLSIQEAARELRYGWFAELVTNKQLTMDNIQFSDSSPAIANRQLPIVNCLLTAHHLDDNIETMLMHFFRGTGIHGLRGMLPKQGHVVRPLLFARKQELVRYAEENKWSWVEDSSNALDKYSRNYFRHHLIPLVQKIYPEAENNLSANLRRFADMEVLYEQSMAWHRKKLLEYKGAEVHIPVLKLKLHAPLYTIIYEIIKDFGFTSAQTDEVLDLLEAESGRYVQSGSHRIIKNRQWLIIAPLQTEAATHVLVEKDDRNVQFAIGNIQLTMQAAQSFQIPAASTVACLDADTVKFPLLLRPWKKGDYFYPLGMPKKKKLARFFIDQKLSLTDKEKVWVLECDKKIVWVVGLRVDDRFKVQPNSRNVLKIVFA